MKLMNKIIRSAQVISRAENEDNIKGIIISTDQPVETNFDGTKIAKVVLSHAKDAVITDWIVDGIPIRYLHGGEVVARGLNVVNDGHSLISNEIVWSDSTLGQKIKADAIKGVLVDISVEADYNPNDCTMTRGEDGVDIITVNKWRVLSCAVVVNHADTACKVIRDVEGEDPAEDKKEDEPKAEETVETPTEATAPVEAPVETTVETPAETTEAPTEEAKEIENEEKVDEQTNDESTNDESHKDGVNLDSQEHPEKEEPEIKEADKSEEIKRMKYSITKAIRSQMKDCRNVDASNEYEVSDNLGRDYGTQAKGIYVDVRRDSPTYMNTTTDAGLVHIEQKPEAYVDALYSNLVITEAGTKVLDGLVGTVNIPVCASTATGYWVAENGDITGSVPEIETMVLAPKQVSALVDISYQLLRSGLPAADQIISEQIEKQIRRAVQASALDGSSDGATQPKGILKTITSDITEWEDVPSYADLVALEGSLSEGVDNGNLVYMMDNAMFSALRAVPLNSEGGDRFVAEYNNGKPMVLDRPCLITSDMPESTIIFGNFAEGLVIGQHSPIDILVDESSLSKKMGTRIVASALVSVGVVANRFVAGTIVETSAGL